VVQSKRFLYKYVDLRRREKFKGGLDTILCMAPQTVDHKSYLYAVNYIFYGIGIRNIINLINSLMSIGLAAFAKLIIIQSKMEKNTALVLSRVILLT